MPKPNVSSKKKNSDENLIELDDILDSVSKDDTEEIKKITGDKAKNIIDSHLNQKKIFFNQIIKMIHSLSEESDIIPNILNEGCRILGATSSVLVIWENKLGFFNTVCGFPKDMNIKGKFIQISEGLSGRIFLEQEIIMVSNYSKSIYAYAPFKKLKYNYAIGAPIYSMDEIVGNVNFYYEEKPKSEEFPQIKKFIEKLGEQLSIVILNSRIYQDLHEKSEKLKKTVNFLNLILNSSPDIIVDIDTSGKINFWNKTATKILGFTPHEIANKKLPLEEKDKEKFIKILIEARRGNSFSNIFLKFLTKSDEIRILNTKIIPIYRGGDEPESILLFGRDVSKKKILEEKIQQVEKQIIDHKDALQRAQKLLDDTKVDLEHAEKMALIGKMYGNLAHQINNPLMIIINLVQLLSDAMDDGEIEMKNDELYTYLTEIPNEIEKIKDVIKILRIYSEIAIQTKMREVFILAVLDDAIKRAKKEFNGDRIKINLERTLTIRKPKINGRYEHLLLSFYNIIENAIVSIKLTELTLKSQGRKSQESDRNVEISVENIQINKIPYVRIQISDSGLGIEASEIRNITQPFYTNWPSLEKINSSYEKKVEESKTARSLMQEEEIGTDLTYISKSKKYFCGMGLTITNTIIKAHSGHIFAKSIYKKGSSFIIDLPLL
ncbi:MAG: PAS domain-containing protein [Promethearchaeota archaeon]